MNSPNHTSTNSSIHPSIQIFLQTSRYGWMDAFIHPFILHATSQPVLHPSIHPSICPYICPSIHRQSVPSCIYQSIKSSMHVHVSILEPYIVTQLTPPSIGVDFGGS